MNKYKTVEKNNKIINEKGLACYDKSFSIMFRDSKRIFFAVEYGQISKQGQLNQDPYFATSVAELSENKNNYNLCGQFQKILTKKELKEFFIKWDNNHLKPLTFIKYKELVKDVNKLKKAFPYVETNSFIEIVKLDEKFN